MECGLIQSVKNDICETCGTKQITMFDQATDKVIKEENPRFLCLDCHFITTLPDDRASFSCGSCGSLRKLVKFNGIWGIRLGKNGV